MNVPPEQIGSDEAVRPWRPRRSARLHALTSKAVLKGRGGGKKRARGLGQTLQRPLWVMPALICGAAKLNDDVIAGLRAKSAPIQIKVEVFPCTSGLRKILWVLFEAREFTTPCRWRCRLISWCYAKVRILAKTVLCMFWTVRLEQETVFIWFQQIG